MLNEKEVAFGNTFDKLKSSSVSPSPSLTSPQSSYVGSLSGIVLAFLTAPVAKVTGKGS